MAKQRVTTRLDEEVVARVQEYAGRTRRPINAALEVLLIEALDRYEADRTELISFLTAEHKDRKDHA